MALERSAEVRRLGLAEAHIAESEARITMQEVILEGLRRDEHDTKEGERLLRGFKDTLAAIQEHRTLILAAIAKIDVGLI